MAKIKLKFLVQDIDRYGHVRTYVRIKGIAKIRIREPFGTDEFMTAYHAAIAGKKDDGTKQYQRAAKGSFGATCLAYYASATFKMLDPATQSQRRRALDIICEKHRDKPIKLMTSKHVRNLRNELTETPANSKNRLAALRALFVWAVETK